MSGVNGVSGSSGSSVASSSFDDHDSSDSVENAQLSDTGLNSPEPDWFGDSPTTEDRLTQAHTQEEQIVGVAANDEPVDLTPPATGLSIAAGNTLINHGTQRLIDNPELVKTWESTTSAWTNKGGFTDGAITRLEDAGIDVNTNPNPTPASSIPRTPGISAGSVTTHNGELAEQAIITRAQGQGLQAGPGGHYDADFNRLPDGSPRSAGDRIVDVEIERPHPTDPRLNQVEHVESKAMRVNAGTISDAQLAHDAGMLRNNQAIRAGGELLERGGQFVRPVGMVIDAVSVSSAIYRDGGVGVETGRTVTGIAGGAAGGFAGAKAGAAAGAALGSIVPGVGTAAGAIVGGVVGGIAGAIGGENIAKSAFNAVRGWFS